MTQLIYDGSYQGWLTAVFEAYEYKFPEVSFAARGAAPLLFDKEHTVITDERKALRVLKGLYKHLSHEGVASIYKAFLSEIPGIENTMWAFAARAFSSKQNIESDLSNKVVWSVREAARRVRKESHRMKAFVRFRLAKDQLFHAIVAPECNVLPLIASHFAKRYADQRWLIYDERRKYGIYYDLKEVQAVQISFEHEHGSVADLLSEEEEIFQKLWRSYFDSTNIKARKNLKLQMQHMPKKYWRYLTEKMIG